MVLFTCTHNSNYLLRRRKTKNIQIKCLVRREYKCFFIKFFTMSFFFFMKITFYRVFPSSKVRIFFFYEVLSCRLDTFTPHIGNDVLLYETQIRVHLCVCCQCQLPSTECKLRLRGH